LLDLAEGGVGVGEQRQVKRPTPRVSAAHLQRVRRRRGGGPSVAGIQQGSAGLGRQVAGVEVPQPPRTVGKVCLVYGLLGFE